MSGIIAFVFVFLMILIIVVSWIKDVNVTSLEQDVRDILYQCPRYLLQTDTKNAIKKRYWRRTIIYGIIFLVLILSGMVAAVVSYPSDALFILIGGVATVGVMCVILAVLTRKDTHKLSENKSVYCVKGYLRKVIKHKGTRVVIAYYDNVQEKYVAKRKVLTYDEWKGKRIEQGEYVDILVGENDRKLNYIGLKI